MSFRMGLGFRAERRGAAAGGSLGPPPVDLLGVEGVADADRFLAEPSWSPKVKRFRHDIWDDLSSLAAGLVSRSRSSDMRLTSDMS